MTERTEFTEGVAAGVVAVLRALVEASGPRLVDELLQRGVDVGRLAPARPLRVLGPVDLDHDDVPELREVGRVTERPVLLDATGYLAELEATRLTVLGETDEHDRWRVRAAKLNVTRARGSEAHAALLEAIAEHGWPAVLELLRWGWREVAAGRRAPKLQACVLSAGGIGALLEAYGREQQAERERLAAEEAERERKRRDAEERRAPAGAPASEYAADLLAGLARAGVVVGGGT